ncbi:MAG: hypothetical protein K6F06_02525 [Bacteroidales bacterium]|nr:hypothetical protein [Bacteroidales bacterium]
MHKLAAIIIGSLLFLAAPFCKAQNYPADPQALTFIKNMYNLEQYEDYSFLRSHCTKKMLKKLVDNFEYDVDGVNYATWLFRSGAQDGKFINGENIQSESKVLTIVAKDDHWYAYTALDMGWKFTNWVYLIKSGNTFLIDDVITIENELDDDNY